MAVRIDVDAVRAAAGASVAEAADKLLAGGALAQIQPAGGGASSVARADAQPPYEVWVGVTADGFTVECDCAESVPDGLCSHGVALTMAALREDFAWSSSATPPSGVPLDPQVRHLAEVASGVPARRLALLVAEHAATDRRLAARLLAYADRAGPSSDAELDAVRETLDGAAAGAVSGRWQLHDIVQAGRCMIEELAVLAERPPTDGALLVVEHAARLWDSLAVHLHDAYAVRDTDPAEIGDELRAIHVQLCEDVQPDPDELIGRLLDIVAAADGLSCLDAPEDYLPVVGRTGVTVLARRH
ncbi:hypothetical protein [Plantactinospora sp. KBS50]|uniref:hypothetical protein n=1 Tax=Plantactinospora sp. KBS50 TaxID=2024580 RepID=UPI000BAB0C09|nr:hypothetical protein [Plantactinospora sp. KBS50]ASW55936.1 hypothetical protein CIK06_19775 [Plantactinospora sp. KBS50]